MAWRDGGVAGGVGGNAQIGPLRGGCAGGRNGARGPKVCHSRLPMYGDGSADLKPIAHLYKTQVWALARHLPGVAVLAEEEGADARGLEDGVDAADH